MPAGTRRSASTRRAPTKHRSAWRWPAVSAATGPSTWQWSSPRWIPGSTGCSSSSGPIAVDCSKTWSERSPRLSAPRCFGAPGRFSDRRASDTSSAGTSARRAAPRSGPRTWPPSSPPEWAQASSATSSACERMTIALRHTAHSPDQASVVTLVVAPVSPGTSAATLVR